LQLRGIDSAQEFLTRHQQEMENGQDQQQAKYEM
jgi:HPr kinase/phosphorylase